MIIRLNPLDTFFFRDGKPFTMGAETWADGIFPPSPSVIYGALRTLWLSEQVGGFSKANIKLSEKLKIRGIYLELDGEICLPVPRDFVHEKDKSENTFILNIGKNEAVSRQLLPYVPLSDQPDMFLEDFTSDSFLAPDAFGFYLKKDKTKKIKVRKSGLKNESKIGIKRDALTYTTAEGNLYRVDFKRFSTDFKDEKRTTIAIKFEGLDFPNNKFVKLGGEGKAASYTLDVDSVDTEIAPLNAPDFQANQFRLILSTPSVFKQGWLPFGIDENNLDKPIEIELENTQKIKFKILSASLGRPLSIGGFDLEKQEPKTMYRAVPAGSVYWFELLEGNMADVVTAFHEKSISEYKADEGFGITYVGK
jgi:CRISPR-associated protein Cmr3